MNIETKRINDPKTCQDFVSGLRNRVETKGYFTPPVEQLLDYLDNNCPTFTEQTRVALGKQAIALSQDRETPLQSLYVVGNLLRGFAFTPEELEVIGGNTLVFLNETYGKGVSLGEHDVDTRIAGWAILNEVTPNASSELKDKISQLSSKVGKLDQEDDFIQKQALELSLRLTTQE
jgi:hypothetical protein